MARDARARLIDNIGRQIRRLNAREKAGGLTEFQKQGLKRQRQNLQDFRDQVKQLSKNDTGKINNAIYDYKTNGNYSSSQKVIDQNSKRLIGSSINPGGLTLSDGSGPGASGAGAGGAQASTGTMGAGTTGTMGAGTTGTQASTGTDTTGTPQGTGSQGSGELPGESEEDSGGDEGVGSEIGGSTVMDEFNGLFGDLAQIDGQYIGIYADDEIKKQVQQILDKIKQLQGGNLDVTPEQMEQLSKLQMQLESKLTAKGNAKIRDRSGRVIGYEATFNNDDFTTSLEGLTSSFEFDVNKWIQENIDLFPNTQSHPGSLSMDERFERDNAGILGDYDY